MPGALTIKLIEANITHDTFKMTTMSPYCVLTVGPQKATSEISVKGGNHPHWDDNLVIQTLGEDKALLEVKDKHFFLPDFSIGSVEIDLKEIEQAKNLKKWLKINHKGEEAGEILVETTYIPGNFAIDEPTKSTVKSVIMNEHLYDRPEKVEYQKILHDKIDETELEEKKEEGVQKPDYSGQGGFIHSEHPGLDKSGVTEQIVEKNKEEGSLLREKEENKGVNEGDLAKYSDFKPVVGDLIEMSKEKPQMDFSGKQGDSSKTQEGEPCDQQTNAGKE